MRGILGYAGRGPKRRGMRVASRTSRSRIIEIVRG